MSVKNEVFVRLARLMFWKSNGGLHPAPTIQQVAEVQDLQELSLSHEAL